MDKTTENINLRNAKIEELMPLITETVQSGGSVTVFPRGVSMLPMLRQGKDSVVLSAKPAQLKKFDIPLYRRADGKYILHRVVKAENGVYTCVGDNQIALEKGVKHESVAAVVTAFIRNGKRYSTDKLTYKLYCRMWCLTRPVRRVWRKLKRMLGKK